MVKKHPCGTNTWQLSCGREYSLGYGHRVMKMAALRLGWRYIIRPTYPIHLPSIASSTSFIYQSTLSIQNSSWLPVTENALLIYVLLGPLRRLQQATQHLRWLYARESWWRIWQCYFGGCAGRVRLLCLCQTQFWIYGSVLPRVLHLRMGTVNLVWTIVVPPVVFERQTGEDIVGKEPLYIYVMNHTSYCSLDFALGHI